MKLYALFSVLFLVVGIASAQNGTSNFGSCDAARVTAGDCIDAAHSFFLISSGSSTLAAVRDTLNEKGGWLATIPCESVRRVENGVLLAAGEIQDSCTLGVDVANPQGANKASVNYLTALLISLHRQQLTVPASVPGPAPVGDLTIP